MTEEHIVDAEREATGTVQIEDLEEALSTEHTKRVKSLAREVVLNFYAAIKVVRYHSVDNAAAQNAMKRFQDTLGDFVKLQHEASIIYSQREFYVNDVRLKTSEADFEFMGAFAAELEARQMGGVIFDSLPTSNELSGFLTIYNEIHPQRSTEPYLEITAHMQSTGISQIRITRYLGNDMGDLPALEKRMFIKQAYFRGILVARQLYRQAQDHKRLNLKVAKRIIQNYVDVLTDKNVDHSDLLLLLTETKGWQGYLFNHAVNTAILAVGFGNALGIKRKPLRALGLSALLADIGNAVIDEALLDSPNPLTGEERAIIQTHPVKAVSLLAAYQQMDHTLIAAINTALHHHRYVDGNGYPQTLRDKPGLFPQIVAVCDRFDALTSPRPWRKRPYTPPRALEMLAKLAGTELNPLLVKSFIDWVGVMPSGTVVLLETGEVAMVMRTQAKLRKQDVLRLKILSDKSEKAVIERKMDFNRVRVVEQLDDQYRNLKTQTIVHL